MNNLPIAVAIGLLLLVSGCAKKSPNVRWQIKKEYPAYSITLGYSLPGNQLREIIGNEFTPKIDEKGNGYLMLFIACAQHYYQDNLTLDSLRIAHILVNTEGSLNCPLTIGNENQELNSLFESFDFHIDVGAVDLSVEQNSQSINVTANIVTSDGNIEMASSFMNNPGDWVYLESTKVSATGNPGSFFVGDESYIPIPIDSIEIKSEGVNWISELNLPAKPNDIWLNTDFIWDFKFTQETKKDANKD